MSNRGYGQSEYDARGSDRQPARRRRSTSKRRRPSALAYGLMLAAVAACALVASVMIFFKVQTIQVTGDNPYTADQVVAASGIKDGVNLLSINESSTEKKIMEQLPYAGSVEVNLKPLSSVVITIHRGTPTCAVAVLGGYALLDKNSKVLEIRQNLTGLQLPTVTGMQIKSARPGYPIAIADQTQLEALKTIDVVLNENKLSKVSQIDVGNLLELSAVYDGRIKLLIGTSTDLQQKAKLGAYVLLRELSNTEKGTLDISDAGKAYFDPA